MTTHMVFIPGLLNSKRVFDSLIAELPEGVSAEAYECEAFDRVETVAENLLSVLPESFIACGFSFGGYVALAMAKMAPERVKGLVLINSSGLPDHPKSAALRADIIERVNAGEYQKIADAQVEFASDPNWYANSDSQAMLKTMIKEYGEQRFVAHLNACINRSDQTAFLRQLTLPTLVVAASDDKIVPLKIQIKTADCIPNCRVVQLDDAGHMLPLEKPKQAADAIARWVSSEF